MKNTFPEYYEPTEAEFKKLWKTASFVFDTNVLLNLYRYTSDTRDQLLEILEALAARVWIPHQAALEYQNNRVSVIAEQVSLCEAKIKACRAAQKTLKDEFKNVGKDRHPFIDAPAFCDKLDQKFNELVAELEAAQSKHPDYLGGGDDIRTRLSQILEGRIGKPFSPEEMEKIAADGEQRNAKGIPPGFADADKSTNPHGDLIIWKEIIRYAAENKQAIIFVTDDNKTDWWWRHGARTIGPRLELRIEFRQEAGVDFYMYSADRFMHYAGEYAGAKVSSEAIDEARSIRLSDELGLAEHIDAGRILKSGRWTVDDYRAELEERETAGTLRDLRGRLAVTRLRIRELRAEQARLDQGPDTVMGLAQRRHLAERRLRDLLDEEEALEAMAADLDSRPEVSSPALFPVSIENRVEAAARAILREFERLAAPGGNPPSVSLTRSFLDKVTRPYGYAAGAIALDGLRSRELIDWTGDYPPGPSTLIHFRPGDQWRNADSTPS